MAWRYECIQNQTADTLAAWLSQDEGAHHYALIDVQRSSAEQIKAVDKHQWGTAINLYGDIEGTAISAMGPRLVQLYREEIPHIAQLALTSRSVSFLLGKCDFATLSAHLQAIREVGIPNQTAVLFRYQDIHVTAALFPILPSAEMACCLGPLAAWAVPDACNKLHIISATGQQRSSGALRFDQKTVAILEDRLFVHAAMAQVNDVEGYLKSVDELTALEFAVREHWLFLGRFGYRPTIGFGPCLDVGNDAGSFAVGAFVEADPGIECLADHWFWRHIKTAPAGGGMHVGNELLWAMPLLVGRSCSILLPLVGGNVDVRVLITFEVVAPFTATEIALDNVGFVALLVSPFRGRTVSHVLVTADGRREDKIVVASAGVPVAEQKPPVGFRLAGSQGDVVEAIQMTLEPLGAGMGCFDITGLVEFDDEFGYRSIKVIVIWRCAYFGDFGVGKDAFVGRQSTDFCRSKTLLPVLDSPFHMLNSLDIDEVPKFPGTLDPPPTSGKLFFCVSNGCSPKNDATANQRQHSPNPHIPTS